VAITRPMKIKCSRDGFFFSEDLHWILLDLSCFTTFSALLVAFQIIRLSDSQHIIIFSHYGSHLAIFAAFQHEQTYIFLQSLSCSYVLFGLHNRLFSSLIQFLRHAHGHLPPVMNQI
jgi:hypothetical protein